MTRLFSTVLLGLLLVSGCSSEGETEGGGRDSQTQTVNGVAFDSPDGWTSLEASEVAQDSEVSDELAEFAERTRMTTEDLQAQLSGVDLYLISEERVDGFLDNIVVTTSTDAGTMTEDQLRQEYEAVGADVQSVEPIDAEDAQGYRVAYELQSGEFLIRGESLSVVSGEDLVSITISSLSAETSSDVADGLVASLEVD